jgi:hypothetical protein
MSAAIEDITLQCDEFVRVLLVNRKTKFIAQRIAFDIAYIIAQKEKGAVVRCKGCLGRAPQSGKPADLYTMQFIDDEGQV